MNSKLERPLKWGLERLALWGELDEEENPDLHVRGEALSSAFTTFDQLAWEIEEGEYE